MRRALGIAAVCVAVVMGDARGTARALEEQYADLPVSVEVASVFNLALDNPQLLFPHLSPGTTQILGEGRFFNALTCRTNAGRPWSVTAQLLSLKHGTLNYALPASQLQWKIVEVSGTVDHQPPRRDFQPFADQPIMIYASPADDEPGHEVVLRLQYSLSCPLDAPAGDYIGRIIFTMTEGS